MKSGEDEKLTQTSFARARRCAPLRTRVTDAQPDVMRLKLKGRYGFVKMALRNGAALVPVIGFGVSLGQSKR